MTLLRAYAVGVILCFGIDIVWVGLVANSFYQKHIGHLMRANVLWAPAALFYLIYVGALAVFVAAPAAEKQSLARAAAFGAFFGVAAYAAFDLTSLALLRDFPLIVAAVDMTWGALLSATISVAMTYLTMRRS